jgi:hypothetical protein
VWDGKFNGHPAPTGRATVVAIFPFIGLEGLVSPDEFETTPVRASIATEINGSNSDARISQGQAIDAALGDAQFAAFVNEAPEGSWINPDVSLIDGTWHVGLFRTKGELDINGYVLVNATGQVVGHRFDR